MTTLDEIAVAFALCPHCGATPGDPCRSKSGRRATYAHAKRDRAAYAAWRKGYGEGRRDTIAMIARYLEECLPTLVQSAAADKVRDVDRAVDTFLAQLAAHARR